MIPLTLATTDATFSLRAKQSHDLPVPKGASCRVVETQVPTGDTVTYNGQPTATPIDVDGATDLSIVNTFAPTTPSSSPPSSPPATTPSSPHTPTSSNAPTSSGGGLAVTGADLLFPFGLGLILITGGLMLWLAGRREHNPKH